MALKYLSFITAIGITQKSTESRISQYQSIIYSTIKEIISSEFLDNNCCFLFTFYSGSIEFNQDWVGINPQMVLKLDNNIFSFSGEEYQNNVKTKRKIDENIQKIKKKIGKLVEFFERREKISRDLILIKLLKMDFRNLQDKSIKNREQYYVRDVREDVNTETLVLEETKWEIEKNKLIKESSLNKKNLTIANEKNLKLNADCVRYKFQNSKLSAQIKSLQEKIKVLENRNQNYHLII